MKKRVLSLILCACLVLTLLPGRTAAAEAEPMIKEIPIVLELNGATGIQLQFLLNEAFVAQAKLTAPADVLADSLYAEKQEGAVYRVSIASVTPITTVEVLFVLQLTLTQEADSTVELYKLMEMTVNEGIPCRAENSILLSGVQDGGSYRATVKPCFNQGTATLNGEPFVSGSEVSAEGSYSLVITDNDGKTRTVSFTIDKTAPVITIAPYDTARTNQSVTVEASTNEGTLNATSHTFTENGSFTFMATDAAGNVTEETVTISHIYKTLSFEILNLPDGLFIVEGMQPDIAEWQLQLKYDGVAGEIIPVTLDMLTLPTSTEEKQATLTYQGHSVRFACKFLPKDVTTLEITTPPVKTTYLHGEDLDITGLVVTLVSGESFRREITDYLITGFDKNTAGVQRLKVEYGPVFVELEVTVKPAVPEHITSQVYTIHDGYLTGAALGSTVDILLAGLEDSTYVKVMKGDSEAMLDDSLATGMTVVLMDGDMVKETLIIVVAGDINGDGRISITDMLAVKSHILGISTLEDAQALAADLSGDGKITITDFVRVKAQILGKDMNDSQ